MFRQRPFLVEALTAIGLIAVPFVLPYVGFTPTTVNRILVWGLFGIGFDILFGITGLLSFGQSAFYGTGGFVAAYLLTILNFPNVIIALFVGMIAAALAGYFVGLIALRRTGIYFAMLTVAIAVVFCFGEFNPLSAYTGGENGLPGVPTPTLSLGFTTIQFNTDTSLYAFLAFWYFVGLVNALRIVRSPVGAVLSAIRDNLRCGRPRLGHNVHGYKLTAFVIAAAYAGFAGGLLGVLQAFMPPDAFTFDTSGQLVMQTAIGGAGTLFGPLVGCAMVWLYLSDFLQTTLHLGYATWCSCWASSSCCWSASCAAALSAASSTWHGSSTDMASRRKPPNPIRAWLRRRSWPPPLAVLRPLHFLLAQAGERRNHPASRSA